MITLDSGVETFAGMHVIIMQIGEDTYELYRVGNDLEDALIIRTDLITEEHVYQIAVFCAGLVDSWDIAE